MGSDLDMMGKITLLADGLMKNGEMWLNVIAFVVVVLVVNLIRTRMMDYAWRIAIVAGGVLYIVIMLAGSMSFGVEVSMVSLIIYTVVAVLIGIILEFFVFGGDYTRTERLEYEDDEYYYYVKAVPKSTDEIEDKRIKKISAKDRRTARSLNRGKKVNEIHVSSKAEVKKAAEDELAKKAMEEFDVDDDWME